MITKKKLNKKLDLLLQRQNILATVVFNAQLTMEGRKKIAEKWNNLWRETMKGKDVVE